MLEFDVISTTSRDVDLMNKYSSAVNGYCWFTKRHHSFPQSLVAQLSHESHVAAVRITAHRDYLPSSVTISLGVPSAKYGGQKSYHADYSSSRHLSFQDSIHVDQHPTLFASFDAPALFIRISVHGFKDEDVNPYGQIGLLSVAIYAHHSDIDDGHLEPKVRPKRDDLHVPSHTNVRSPSPLHIPSLPIMASSKSKEKMMPSRSKTKPLVFESDDDDVDVIFSKEMVTRLKNKSSQLQQDLLPEGARKAPVKQEEPESMPSTKMADNEPDLPLTPRTKKRILDEIAGYGESPKELARKRRGRQIYFGGRMAEFNNLVRALETKREHFIWDEKYADAAAIDENLKELRSRESGLKELLVERERALNDKNLISAQRAKDRFEKNLSDALYLPQLRGFLSDDELRRLRIADRNV